MKNYQDVMKIVSHRALLEDVYEMILEGEGAKFIQAPGQFINIKLTDDSSPYLRRPMSICDYDDTHIMFIYRVVGEGTKVLSKKKVGETLDVLIGLGNGFPLPDIQKALVIGGGLGVPPMYNTTKQLLAKGIEVTCVLGFNSKEAIFYQKEFEALTTTYLATMDGSVGTKGTVLDAIREHQIDFDAYFACGPEKMLDALVLAYPEHGYLSFEARMGCGFGACMGCSCKTKTKPYKRICVEGPVLESSEVIVNG